MNIRNTLIILCLLTVFPLTVSAKVLPVLPGESIQEKIDEAEDNDFVAIFGGTYAEDITIDGKVIRLVEVKGQDVKLTGNVTFKNITNPPPFEGFELTGDGKTLYVQNITGEMIINQLSSNGNVRVEGGEGSVTIKDSNLRAFHKIGHNLSIINCKFSGGYGSDSNDYNTTVFRSTFNYAEFWSKNISIGYSKFLYIKVRGKEGAQFNFIGNEIDRQDQEGYGLRVDNNGFKFLIANNHIHNIKWNREWNEEIGIWVDGSAHQGIIQNNLIKMNYGGDNYRNDSNAIRIGAANPKIKIRNNLFWGCMHEINAPFGIVSEGNMIKNSVAQGGHYAGLQFKGGIIDVEMPVIEDPLFGDTVYQLKEGSPLVNAGSDNPLYNDRDGTRNDVGPSGGVWYDSQGWTTEKPVVISFDLSSESVLEGIDTEITISGGRAVSSSSSSEE